MSRSSIVPFTLVSLWCKWKNIQEHSISDFFKTLSDEKYELDQESISLLLDRYVKTGSYTFEEFVDQLCSLPAPEQEVYQVDLRLIVTLWNASKDSVEISDFVEAITMYFDLEDYDVFEALVVVVTEEDRVQRIQGASEEQGIAAEITDEFYEALDEALDDELDFTNHDFLEILWENYSGTLTDFVESISQYSVLISARDIRFLCALFEVVGEDDIGYFSEELDYDMTDSDDLQLIWDVYQEYNNASGLIALSEFIEELDDVLEDGFDLSDEDNAASLGEIIEEKFHIGHIANAFNLDPTDPDDLRVLWSIDENMYNTSNNLDEFVERINKEATMLLDLEEPKSVKTLWEIAQENDYTRDQFVGELPATTDLSQLLSNSGGMVMV